MSVLIRTGTALLVALSVACVQPELVRDGVRVPYETAADGDIQRARAEIKAGQTSEARATLVRLLTELPRSRRTSEALYLLGGVEEQLGERERAAAAWRDLVTNHGRSRFAPEAALRGAQIYSDLGRFEAGRRLLAEAPVESADAATRVKIHRLSADLSRALGDYPESVLSLAYSRRDLQDLDSQREVDIELNELIESRLTEEELSGLVYRLPRGPIYDRVNLLLASRALSRGDKDAARTALDRLPGALRPSDAQLRDELVSRLKRGQGNVAETLGLAIPLSGPYAPFGESVLRGTALALGLYDDPDAHFRLLVRDTGGDIGRGQTAVRELVEAGVSGIIGPLRSSVAAAAAPLAEQGAVPMLTLAKSEEVAGLGDYVFRLGLSVSDEARALARYSTETKGHRRFAILYPDDAYGRKFKNLFWAAVEEHGGEIVGSEAYLPDAVDWQSEIKKLVGMYYLSRDEQRLVEERDRLRKRPDRNAEKLASPRLQGLPPFVDFDALFIPDDAAKVGLILPQLRFYDIRKVTFLGGSAWNDPTLVEIAPDEARSAVFIDAFHPRSQKPMIVSFAERYIAAYGEEPDALAAEGFDAGLLFMQAIDGNLNLSRAGLRQSLLDTRDFPGVSGVTSFDEGGGTRKDVHFLTVRKGEIQTLDPLP